MLDYKSPLSGILICLFILTATAGAVDKRDTDRIAAARFSMVGIRLGAWVDQGGSIVLPNVTANFPDASFYTELYYDHRLTPALLGELSLGVSTRGDATYFDGFNQYIGTINLYPILLQLKFSPLTGVVRKIHPYLIGGGGLVVGKQSTDIIVGSFLPSYLDPETRTDFMTVFGGGVDLPLAEQIGLNISAKYHWIDFDKDLAGVNDYSGLAISVGIAYFLHKK